METAQVLVFLYAFSVVVVHSTKVIYVNFGDHNSQDIMLHAGGIIHVPGEKPKCKDHRTPDRTGNCRKIVEF